MGHEHRHHHGHDRHGNPEDLAGYLAKLEDPSRDEWQRPGEVLDLLELEREHTVCDAGAGPGYFALKLAARCRHVFACDVEPGMLGVLRERLTTAGRHNVTPVLALPTDPLVPPGSCDRVLLVNTFHHFPDGPSYLRALAGLLKPGGWLVNIDFQGWETPVGPAVEHRVSREDFLRQAEAAGLRVTAEHRGLPHQYFLVLQPRGGSGATG